MLHVKQCSVRSRYMYYMYVYNILSWDRSIAHMCLFHLNYLNNPKKHINGVSSLYSEQSRPKETNVNQ